ncbi:PTS lactose/cellobiose transporter subunit IIA [Halanaerobaculum tunisiense]
MTSEKTIFTIITEAGNAKGLAFEAFSLAKEGEFEAAEEKLKESNKCFNKAHDIQTELISKEAQGEGEEVNILMVHAQDHLATATLTKDLVNEMIGMQKEINSLKQKGAK